jgi:hypothetical protein
MDAIATARSKFCAEQVEPDATLTLRMLAIARGRRSMGIARIAPGDIRAETAPPDVFAG